MKKMLLTGLVLALCLLTACGRTSGDGLTALCGQAGLDLSAARTLWDKDTHGGFHGDGTRLTALAFPEGPGEGSLTAAGWKPLPLDETTEAVVYGVIAAEAGEDGPAEVTTGPFIPLEAGMGSIPRIEHGYYFFRDRYPDDGPERDAALPDRGAFNFTVALYDSDAHILYYCETDT